MAGGNQPLVVLGVYLKIKTQAAVADVPNTSINV
jgi:hypothetical protein